MSAQPKPYLTPEDYLHMERQADFKSEYFEGEVFAMSGGSPAHSQIAMNVGVELGSQLKRRPCIVYSSDLRVKVPPTGLYTYPDVSVVCGQPVFDGDPGDTLTNPILLVEVLSPSSEAYDRGRKFDQYRLIPSLQEYVLVSQQEARVTLFSRQADGRWLLSDAVGMDAQLRLDSIGCDLALADVYLKVDLTPPARST